MQRLRTLIRIPAARGFIVVLLVLVFASLLNAQGLRKTAEIQPTGFGRTVGLAVTLPLVSTSHFLYLDRPRQELRAAIGRGDDDIVNTKIDIPKPLPKPKPKPRPHHGHKPHHPKPPPKVVFSPAHPLRIWVAGDSLAEVPGQSLDRLTGGKTGVDVVDVESRLSTGLGRPDVYNWFNRVKQAKRDLHMKVAVLSFGADDAHSYMTGATTDLGPIGSASWRREYERRVDGVTRELNGQGVYVVWLGVPISDSPNRNAEFRFIDKILRGVAERYPKNASYINAYSLFACHGEYCAYMRNKNGQLVLMRATDGIHYTQPAGDLVARAVLAQLRSVYDLRAKP